MKKRLIGLLLVAVMLVPLLSSCISEPPVLEVAAPIYTLYTIADATPEAIREVELALNRILFFRIGVCIDIIAVTEDEYDELIEKQYQIMEEYTLERKNKSKSKTTSEAVDDTPKKIMTGERIIEMLENGEDIKSDNPRLDIFLVRGYEEYFRLATTGMLSAIDDKLSNEAKLIRDYIHSTFFSAAKLNKKTYGVPVNSAIGEYEYIVFDKELLEKYGYDAQTMVSLKDLEEYLELIKENEPDVVPLKKATDSADHTFMFENGFATFVSDTGVVTSTYEDNELLSYYAMIARYNALGYFNNSAEESDARFAVTFVSGDETDINAITAETGHEYSFNIYQMPVATNENTIKNIYSISKYCISNELTDVMKLLTQIYTDSGIQNILTYGIYGTHYVLNDNNQVRRLNSDYIINPDYTGNKFITYTLEGEDSNKWDAAKKQNLDSIASKLLGFDVIPVGINYTDEENITHTIYEPLYVEIMQQVIDNYYPSIINGSIVELNIVALKAEMSELVYNELSDELEKKYKTKISDDYAIAAREKFLASSEAKKVRAEVEADLWEQILGRVRGDLTAELTTYFREQLGAGATNEEIQAEVEKALTEEYLWENRYYEFSEEYVDELMDAQFEKAVVDRVGAAVADYLESKAYESAISKAINSAAFEADLAAAYAKNGPSLINQKIDVLIAEMISAVKVQMIEELNEVLEAVVTAFVEEYKEILELTSDELLHKIGYLKQIKEDNKTIYENEYESYYEFVIKGKIEKQYYSIYPLPAT